METPLLDQLPLSNKGRPQRHSDRHKLRQRIVAGLLIQKEAAISEAEGRRYVCTQKRWKVNEETGRKVLVDVPIRFRQWWWKDDNGNLQLGIRYGYKFIELKSGYLSIEVQNMNDMEKMIDKLIAAVDNGDLDESLLKARHQRKYKS